MPLSAMSNPTEPKFPKRHFNSYFRAEMVAPDGCYLLPARTVLTTNDLSWTRGGWSIPLSPDVDDRFAWTYARKLPDGQLNDDLPVQTGPDPVGIAVDASLAEEQRRRSVAEAQVTALRKEVAEYKSHPGAPVLRMTHDGKVTAFGAIEAPPGYYLLPAGEMLQNGDVSLTSDGGWFPALAAKVHLPYQFTYARKLSANGPVS